MTDKSRIHPDVLSAAVDAFLEIRMYDGDIELAITCALEAADAKRADMVRQVMTSARPPKKEQAE